jgi:hypothetical protein
LCGVRQIDDIVTFGRQRSVSGSADDAPSSSAHTIDVDADGRVAAMRFTRSLNHLTRPQQQRERDCQAKGLRGLQIDHQLELSRLLDREVGGLGALRTLSTYVADRRG